MSVVYKLVRAQFVFNSVCFKNLISKIMFYIEPYILQATFCSYNQGRPCVLF